MVLPPWFESVFPPPVSGSVFFLYLAPHFCPLDPGESALFWAVYYAPFLMINYFSILMIRCDAKHSNAEDWLNGAGEPEELLEDSEGESSRSPVPPPDLAQVHNTLSRFYQSHGNDLMDIFCGNHSIPPCKMFSRVNILLVDFIKFLRLKTFKYEEKPFFFCFLFLSFSFWTGFLFSPL